jgi:hypothetical protein
MFFISIFTYYFIDYYYQIDKLERNKIISLLEDDFKDVKTINYDLGIFTEKSQNGLHYIWLLPDRLFNLFSNAAYLSAQSSTCASRFFFSISVVLLIIYLKIRMLLNSSNCAVKRNLNGAVASTNI